MALTTRSMGLGQLPNHLALIGRAIYEIVLSKKAIPGASWPHPYADKSFWDRAFARSGARSGTTHDWLLAYSEIKSFPFEEVSNDATSLSALQSGVQLQWRLLVGKNQSTTIEHLVKMATAS